MQYDPVTNTFDASEAPADGTLPHVMWHVTDVCPLNCGYCFSPKTEASVDSVHALLIVNRLQALGTQKVDIAGGEPGILLGLPSIIELISGSGMHCTVTTSGVGRQENMGYLASNVSRLSRLIISIDAVTSHHDQLRNFPGAWRAATKLVDSVDPNLRKRLVRINTVITEPLLASDGLPLLAEAISGFGIHEWCLIEPHPANAKPRFVEHEIAAAEFQAACALVRSSFPHIKLLVRSRELYSSYWVLHPDGVLRQHSNTSIDREGIALMKLSTEDIRNQISQTKIRLPSKGDRL